jgi:UDP-glucose 4-epimerase
MARRSTARRTRGGAGPEAEGAFVITGACGRLGQLLTRRLHREGPVIAIDRRPFPDRPKDVVHVPYPIRRKKVRDIFRRRKIRAVVHLGMMHDPRKKTETHHAWNVEGFAKLLEYCKAYGVTKLVLMSSASLYGARPSNPQYITEEAPLMAGSRFAWLGGQVEVDMLAQSFFWREPDCETVILRPSPIVGKVQNASSNYIRLEVCPTIMGFDPLVQPIHEQDVIDAVVAALEPGIRGVYNLAGPTVAPLHALLRRLGKPSLPVPHPLARPLLRRLFDWKLASFPAGEVDFVQYQCLVDDARARRTLGWAPRRSIGEVLDDACDVDS